MTAIHNQSEVRQRSLRGFGKKQRKNRKGTWGELAPLGQVLHLRGFCIANLRQSGGLGEEIRLLARERLQV